MWGSVIEAGLKIIDKVVPDPAAKSEAQRKLIEMQQAGELRELELEVADRDSARKREMVVGGFMNGILSVAIMIGFFGIVYVMFNKSIPADNEEVLYMLLGSLGTMATQVVAYYFGSSSGSKQKTHLMKKS